MIACQLLAGAALAQQPTPAAIAAAKELVELKGGSQMFDPVIVSIVEQTKGALLQTNPQLAKDLNDVAAQLRTEFAPRRDELLTEAARRYAARFTEAELKEMVTFFKSPLGKKMIAQEPQVLDETFSFVQQQFGAARRRRGDEPLPRRDEEEGAQSLSRCIAMSEFDTDLFVIGGGSGGVRAARIAAGYGARVMLAEEFRVGGTCVIRGCVPKKLLVYASRFSHAFEDAEGYGWTVGATSFDWATLIANKDKEIARLEAAYTANLTRSNVTIVKTRAVLEDAHTVRLLADDRRVRAKHILIATGGWPGMGTGIAGIEHVISSNEAFHLTELPKRILIQGGGYIAVEFACIFAGLGSRRDAGLSRRQHPARLRRRRAHASARRDGAARHQDHLQAHRRGGREGRSRAVRGIVRPRRHRGRQGDVRDRPAARTSRGSGLEAAGVKLNDKGAIEVDEFSRTSVPHIYAVGDVTDRLALTPVAIREGHAFADTVFGGRPTEVDHTNVPTAVFSEPEIGVIGLTETQARERYTTSISSRRASAR